MSLLTTLAWYCWLSLGTLVLILTAMLAGGKD
jgi:hypothetical protein